MDAARSEFAYHKSLSPMLGLLLGIALVETFTVHIVAMAVWGWRVALVLLAIDISAVVALVQLLRSFRRLPVLIEGRTLTMRAGSLKAITIDIDQIADLRRHWDADAVRRRNGVLNLALIAWPNIVIDLKAPRGTGWRRVVAVAHRLDDPEAFRIALARLGVA